MDNFVSQNKAAVLRFLRTLAFVVIAAVVAYLSSPDVLDIFGPQVSVVVGAVVVPFLAGLEKYFRTPNGEVVVAPGSPVSPNDVLPKDSTDK